MQERRFGKDRRAGGDRRTDGHAPWLIRLKLVDKRGSLDRRAGLDRRASLRSDFHHEGIIEIRQKRMIKSWDCAKAKMTYLWDTGLEAITFARFKEGAAVEVSLTTPQGVMSLSGHVLRYRKVFTERGFATEMDVQFDVVSDHQKAVINQIIWGD